jgi:hypothetical protein
MAYNVTSLTQEIKSLAKDTSFPDSLITGYLQETQDRVLGRHRFPFLEGVDSLALSVGDTVKNYAAVNQTISSLRLSDGSTVTRPEYIGFREFDELYPAPATSSPGRPTVFTDYGRQVYWNIPLDKAYTMTWRYMRKPVTLSSGAIVPDIPEEYKSILIHGALAGVEEYRENFDLAAVHLRRVEDLSEDFLLRYGVRQLLTPHKYSKAFRKPRSDRGWRLG